MPIWVGKGKKRGGLIGELFWPHEWIVHATRSSPESPLLVASFISLLRQCIPDDLLEHLGPFSTFMTFPGKEKNILKHQYH